MEKDLPGFRAVITKDENEFGKILGIVLSPSRPLQSPEYLRGREEQLQGIRKAFFQPGRHILIHGLRGVGKSSLAQTAAFMLSGNSDPIVLGCDQNTGFLSIVREIFDSVEARHPAIKSIIVEKGLSFARYGILASGKKTETIAKVDPGSVNEAVRLLRFVTDEVGKNLVIVVDEFDQVSDEADQKAFANFIKQVSDQHVDIKFIVCGIADSPEILMAAHASADRYFHTVELGKLPWEARFEIVVDASKKLGIITDDSTVIRIAKISDGFPHYVHFISEKLFWRVYEARNDGRMNAACFTDAMHDASSAMDMKLRGPYEKATQKYSNDYEYVLWAAADGHELRRRSIDIFESYNRIMRYRQEDALSRDKFNQRLNALKRESHSKILIGTRQGWYEFNEKMVRGYVRLRAEQSGINLDGDHPTLLSSSRWRDMR